mmetsp:Transcript_22594/g.77239  ORF Transcript_22594/g.77239 Transcript_22594/m.77239 type:complete len:271 (+) Transcript_22594:1027-1839(+)
MSRPSSTDCTTHFDASGSTKSKIPLGLCCTSSTPKYARQPRGVADSCEPRTRTRLWSRMIVGDTPMIKPCLSKKKGVALPSSFSGVRIASKEIPESRPDQERYSLPLDKMPLLLSTATPMRLPCMPMTSSNALAISATSTPSCPLTNTMPKSHFLPDWPPLLVAASAASSITALCQSSFVLKIDTKSGDDPEDVLPSGDLACACKATTGLVLADDFVPRARWQWAPLRTHALPRLRPARTAATTQPTAQSDEAEIKNGVGTGLAPPPRAA